MVWRWYFPTGIPAASTGGILGWSPLPPCKRSSLYFSWTPKENDMDKNTLMAAANVVDAQATELPDLGIPVDPDVKALLSAPSSALRVKFTNMGS